MAIIDPVKRLRRNRIHPAIRSLIQETHLNPSDFVIPLFVKEGLQEKTPIASMPGVFRFSQDLILNEARECIEKGILACALFPSLEKLTKDSVGSESLNENNLINTTIRKLKDKTPEMFIFVDIALDPYTDHGHDGVIDSNGIVINDETVERLCEMAIVAAKSGADMVAPSDMMDGRVNAIRQALDENGYSQVGILSYAAKYASSLYGPFRDAALSKLKSGDKKSYQLNPANAREALLECDVDEAEGADILMVKPALSYLDIIAKLRARTELPIAAYHVSGEYSMVMAAHERGWLNGPKVLEEHLLSIKRAGADIIFSYGAKLIVDSLNS